MGIFDRERVMRGEKSAYSEIEALRTVDENYGRDANEVFRAKEINEVVKTNERNYSNLKEISVDDALPPKPVKIVRKERDEKRKNDSKLVAALFASGTVVTTAAVIIATVVLITVTGVRLTTNSIDLKVNVVNADEVPLSVMYYDASGNRQPAEIVDGHIVLNNLIEDSVYKVIVSNSETGEVYMSEQYKTLKTQNETPTPGPSPGPTPGPEPDPPGPAPVEPLTVNVELVEASANALTFEITLSRLPETLDEEPIIAYIEGGNESYGLTGLTQQVTFDLLTPETEYVLTVRDSNALTGNTYYSGPATTAMSEAPSVTVTMKSVDKSYCDRLIFTLAADPIDMATGLKVQVLNPKGKVLYNKPFTTSKVTIPNLVPATTYKVKVTNSANEVLFEKSYKLAAAFTIKKKTVVWDGGKMEELQHSIVPNKAIMRNGELIHQVMVVSQDGGGADFIPNEYRYYMPGSYEFWVFDLNSDDPDYVYVFKCKL